MPVIVMPPKRLRCHHQGGRLKRRAALGGFPSDALLFWRWLASRGVRPSSALLAAARQRATESGSCCSSLSAALPESARPCWCASSPRASTRRSSRALASLSLGADMLPYGAVLHDDATPDRAARPGRGGPAASRWRGERAGETAGCQNSAELAQRGDMAGERLFEDVLILLERSAPPTIVVEDLQWADKSSLELLVFLVRNLRRPGIVLIVTYRPGVAVDEPIASLARGQWHAGASPADRGGDHRPARGPGAEPRPAAQHLPPERGCSPVRRGAGGQRRKRAPGRRAAGRDGCVAAEDAASPACRGGRRRRRNRPAAVGGRRGERRGRGGRSGGRQPATAADRGRIPLPP